MDSTETSPLRLLRAVAKRAYRLLVVASPDATAVGTTIPLTGALTLGRRGELAIADPRMSGQHCQFRRSRGGLWLLADLDSKNGVCVDGRLVSRPVMLAEGAVIRAGNTLLVFDRVPDAPEATVQPASSPGSPDAPVFVAASSCELLDWIMRRAPTRMHLLVTGESGVGKEVVAEAIHAASGRRGPLIRVNAGAIPATLREAHLFGHLRGAFTGADRASPGYVQAADGGTLFLDEVAELEPSAQVALLRVLENREVLPVGAVTPRKVDVRVVAATNEAVDERVLDGRFRADLLARFGDRREIAPLRSRRADIAPLCERLLASDGASLHVDALEAVLVAPWPLNVRELGQVLERAALDAPGGQIDLRQLPDDLAEPVRERTEHQAVVTRPEREELVAALERHGGVVAAVARFYGKDRRQIYRWMTELGIDRT